MQLATISCNEVVTVDNMHRSQKNSHRSLEGTKKRPSTSVQNRRGNLYDYLIKDQKDTRKLVSVQEHCGNEEAGKDKISAVHATVNNGILSVDRKLLVDECEREFEDKWFFKEPSVRFIRHKLDSLAIFDIPTDAVSRKTFRAQTADAAKLPSTEPLEFEAATYITQPNQPLLASKKHRHKSRLSVEFGLGSMSIEESTSLTSATTTSRKLLKGLVRKFNHEDPLVFKEKVRDRQNTYLRNIAANQNSTWNRRDHLTEVTANDILFLECLRNHVLPYPIKPLQSIYDQHIKTADERDQELEQLRSTSLGKVASYVAKSVSSEIDGPESRKLSPIAPSSTAIIHDNIVNVLPTTITNLDLSGRGIGKDRGLLLAEALMYCPSLQSLLLSSNGLNDNSCSAILERAFQHCQIINIDLSENILGSMTIEKLAHCVQVSCFLP